MYIGTVWRRTVTKSLLIKVPACIIRTILVNCYLRMEILKVVLYKCGRLYFDPGCNTVTNITDTFSAYINPANVTITPDSL